MKQMRRYTLDLNKIEGDGEFSCQRCGTLLSPEDETEEAYSILQPIIKVKGLEELVIKRNKCGIHIHLTGFSLLQNLSEVGEA